MTYKTFEDNTPTYVFKYVFTDLDTARVARHGLSGFMVGIYDQVALETTINGYFGKVGRWHVTRLTSL